MFHSTRESCLWQYTWCPFYISDASCPSFSRFLKHIYRTQTHTHTQHNKNEPYSFSISSSEKCHHSYCTFFPRESYIIHNNMLFQSTRNKSSAIFDRFSFGMQPSRKNDGFHFLGLRLPSPYWRFNEWLQRLSALFSTVLRIMISE